MKLIASMGTLALLAAIGMMVTYDSVVGQATNNPGFPPSLILNLSALVPDSGSGLVACPVTGVPFNLTRAASPNVASANSGFGSSLTWACDPYPVHSAAKINCKPTTTPLVTPQHRHGYVYPLIWRGYVQSMSLGKCFKIGCPFGSNSTYSGSANNSYNGLCYNNDHVQADLNTDGDTCVLADAFHAHPWINFLEPGVSWVPFASLTFFGMWTKDGYGNTPVGTPFSPGYVNLGFSILAIIPPDTNWTIEGCMQMFVVIQAYECPKDYEGDLSKCTKGADGNPLWLNHQVGWLYCPNPNAPVTWT